MPALRGGTQTVPAQSPSNLVFHAPPPPIQRLVRRGGVAAGEQSRNPSDTTYAASPPSSTYTGPKIAGSKGGFIGLVTGLGIFCILVALGVWLVRRRRRNKLNSKLHSAFPDSRGASAGVPSRDIRGRGWGRAGDGDEMDDGDAFEMPSQGYTPSTTSFGPPSGVGEGRKWLNPSTMSLDNDYNRAHAASGENLVDENPFRDDVKVHDGRSP
ncbi:hypothetical protein T439DRAFT_376528 [Meredithblackwellia eburnea MCA 4105]